MKEQELKEIEKRIIKIKEKRGLDREERELLSLLSTIEAQAEKVTELDDLATEQAEIIRNKSKKIADQAKELERVKEDARQRMLMIEELGSKLTAAEEELEQTRDARDKALSQMASFEQLREQLDMWKRALDGLVPYIQELLHITFESESLDAFELLDLGKKHGLLKTEPYEPELYTYSDSYKEILISLLQGKEQKEPMD